MANLMVRELELNEELDRKALVNIVGGEGCAQVDPTQGTLVDQVVNGDIPMMTFDGGMYCVGTQLDGNSLKQVWRVRQYRVFYKAIDSTYLCDFCAVGCP